MLSDKRLVYELEREVRCESDPASSLVVSAYTLRVIFDRLALAEGRTPGIDPDHDFDEATGYPH
ncbi:hypothetical protein [Hyphomicrobium sp. DY-1]|uniref:hypothetical protein n=1 Tax=Hyphomicrobium sp. DY-1 TaxID=3075650 RepID=UPI0039C3021B